MALPTLLEIVSCNVEYDAPPPTLPYPFTPTTGAATLLKSPVTVHKVYPAVNQAGEPMPFWWVSLTPYHNPDPWVLVPHCNFSDRFILAFGVLQRHLLIAANSPSVNWRGWYQEGEAVIRWLDWYLAETELLPDNISGWLIEVLYRWLADPNNILILVCQTRVLVSA